MASERPAPGWRRQHPSALLFELFGLARALIAPGVAVIVLARDDMGQRWIMFLFAPLAIYTVTRFLTTRYELRTSDIVVRRGLLARNERHVPIARVQDVDQSQSPLHRLLGVAKVELRTASGAEPEASFSALSLPAVEELKRHLAAARAPDSEPDIDAPTQARPTLRLARGDLLRLGVIDNRALASLAAGMALASQFDLFERLFDLPVFRGLDSLLEGLPGAAGAWALALFIGGAIGFALLIAPLLSCIFTALRFGGFKLELDGDVLRLTRGVLTREAVSLPRHRLQRLSIVESPLHRMFGVVTIRAANAGQGDAAQGTARLHSDLVPLIASSQVSAFFERFLPAFELPLEWRSAHPRAPRRILRKALLLAVLASAAIIATLQWRGVLIAVPLVFLIAWHARRAGHTLAWAMDQRQVASRHGAFTRRIDLAPIEKLQSTKVKQTPFDRRWNMARVGVDTAGGVRIGRLSLDFLEAGEAERAAADLTRSAGRHAFRW